MTRNHIIGLIAGAIAIINISSCNKIKDAAKVNIGLTSSEIQFTIQPISQAGSASITEYNIYLNVDSIIKANNSKLSSKNIRSVKITEFTIRITNATVLDSATNTNNFSALQYIKVDLASNTKTDLVTIAELANNPDVYAVSLTIPPKDVELKDYFNATNFTYKISGTLRRGTTKDLNCVAVVKYNLEAGL